MVGCCSSRSTQQTLHRPCGSLGCRAFWTPQNHLLWRSLPRLVQRSQLDSIDSCFFWTVGRIQSAWQEPTQSPVRTYKLHTARPQAQELVSTETPTSATELTAFQNHRKTQNRRKDSVWCSAHPVWTDLVLDNRAARCDSKDSVTCFHKCKWPVTNKQRQCCSTVRRKTWLLDPKGPVHWSGSRL